MEKQLEKLGEGFLVLLGITHNDTKENEDYLVKKLCKLRVFRDDNEEATSESQTNLEKTTEVEINPDAQDITEEELKNIGQ